MVLNRFISILLAAFFAFGAGSAGGQNFSADEAGTVSRIEDRIKSSLFFRGEIADRLIAAGAHNSLLNLSGMETYADIREALIVWVGANPGRAALFYAEFAAGRLPVSADGEPPQAGALPAAAYKRPTWRLNKALLGLIGKMGAAASDGSLSFEELSLAGGQLFEGDSGAEATAPAAGFDGAFSPAGRSSPLRNNGGYAVSPEAVKRELGRFRGWLNALRSVPGSASSSFRFRDSLLKAALAEYKALRALAEGVGYKGVMTSSQRAELLRLSSSLRLKLAALILLEFSARARSVEDINPAAAAEAAALAGRLEKEAAAAASGNTPEKGLSAAVKAAAGDYAELYTKAAGKRYLDDLEYRLQRDGRYSCLHDYLYSELLEKFYPDNEYALLRKKLSDAPKLIASARAELESGLEEERAGEIAEEISGVEESLKKLPAYSGPLRRIQFYLFGLPFRPLELEISYTRKNRLVLRPVVTFFSLKK